MWRCSNHIWKNQVLRAPLDASGGGSVASNRPAAGGSIKARQGQPKAAPAGSLGIDGGIVGRSATPITPPASTKTGKSGPVWQETRRTIWALSRTAASLVFPKGTAAKDVKGVGTCRWAVRSRVDGVDVNMSAYESGQQRASFGGLQTCGLVWQCPACAARISETRRRQVNSGLEWAKGQGYRIAMLTLTARHGADDDLKTLLMGMKEAKRRLHQHRAWKRIKPDLVALLTATEVTHGKNGWHPHFHMIVIVRTKAAEAGLALLGDPWRGALRAEGLDGADAAFDCRDASTVGRYVSKWGAGEELTLSGKKRAKGKGRTPLNLLEAHKAGNEETGNLWLEYVAAFHRRTQLDGLSKLVRLAGLEELTDAEAAQDDAQDGQEQEGPIANIDTETWRRVGRYRRTDLLDAAEDDGPDGVARVLAGRNAWRKSDLIEDDPVPEPEPPPPPPVLPDSLRDQLMRSIWTADELDAFVDHIEPPARPVTPEMRAAAIARSKARFLPVREDSSLEHGKSSLNTLERRTT
jgi:hypothetical protein